MAIPEKQLDSFRKALDESARPLIFFDGDVDGLTSFALLHKRNSEGKGVMISGRPQLTMDFARRIDENAPDAVFILDLAQITQEFVDHIKCPIHWLDHHKPQHDDLKMPKRLTYYNPRLEDPEDGSPTSYWAYRIVKDNLWVAMAGIIGDYHWDAKLAAEFREKYPGLLPIDITNQGSALFNSPLGTLIRIINFNLKGTVTSAMTAVKIFTRIEDPKEILEQTTPRGNYLYKRYQRVLKAYEELYETGKECIKKDDPLILYVYNHDQYSLSGELANELKWRNKDKVVIIARNNDDKMVMSLRGEDKEVHGPLQIALEGLDGYGGGHPKACGAVVAESQFEEFIKKFRKAIE